MDRILNSVLVLIFLHHRKKYLRPTWKIPNFTMNQMKTYGTVLVVGSTLPAIPNAYAFKDEILSTNGKQRWAVSEG